MAAEINFGGKRALVTGAAQGIGKETALTLLRCKARVIALDIDQAALDLLKQEYPEIEIVRADVTDWNGVKKIVEDLGPIDLLVNNAGILALEKIGEVTEACLSKVLDVNVKSLFNISQVVSNGMKARGTGGAIVNLASICSRIPWPGMGAYAVSKAGVAMLNQVLALELGPHQIRVNAVSPTIVSSTDMGKIALGLVGESDLPLLMARHSLGKLAGPSHVANAIVFLLSDLAELIHGANLPIDAGVLAT